MIILLMGPQGSGKGTQGEFLSDKFGIPVVSTGDMLRDEIAAKTPLGIEVESVIKTGNLVSPEQATRVISERIKKEDAVDGIIIDGYPRDSVQLEMMFKYFTPDIAVVLNLSDDEALKRLGGRLMCPNGHTWNEVSKKPKVAGICDEDGEKLFQRDDDTKEAIIKRLGIYRTDTEPLISGLRDSGVIVVEIDASESIEDVRDNMFDLLSDYIK